MLAGLVGFTAACGGAGGRGDEALPEPEVPDILALAPGAPWTGASVQEAYLKAPAVREYGVFGSAVAVSGDTAVVVSGGFVHVFERSGGVWNLEALFEGLNKGHLGALGGSVALDGDTLVVGAAGDDSSAVGVNGDPHAHGAVDSGAAYVFVRSGGGWSLQAYLKASNAGAGDLFGHDVAISGNVVAVGAPREDSRASGVNGTAEDEGAANSGAAYLFVRSGSNWTQQAYVKASNTGAGDEFGFSVGISRDLLAVGAFCEDGAATGVNGVQTNDATVDAGAAYVFVTDSAGWRQQAYVKPPETDMFDWFGWSVAVHGNTLVVGAPLEDSAAAGVDSNPFDDSSLDAGAAFVYVRNGATWSQQAYLKASNTGFGDVFGWGGVAVCGDAVVVGAPGEDSRDTGLTGTGISDVLPSAGAAYAFARDGATWRQATFIKASNTGAGDQFGDEVAFDGRTILVGAQLEDGGATGVNGNQNSESAVNSGAVYLYR